MFIFNRGVFEGLCDGALPSANHMISLSSLILLLPSSWAAPDVYSANQGVKKALKETSRASSKQTFLFIIFPVTSFSYRKP